MHFNYPDHEIAFTEEGLAYCLVCHGGEIDLEESCASRMRRISRKTKQHKNNMSNDPNVIKLEKVRLSYPQLFDAKPPEEGKEPVFSASFLLDKKQHADLIKQIEKMTDRVALDAFKKKVTLKRVPLRDGNEKDGKEGYGDEVMFVSARNAKRPVVVDRDLTPLTKEDTKPYAGCYVNATIRLFAYDHKTGGKGVSASLRAVQFVRDGESFGAAPVNAEEEFEAVTDDVDGY